MNLSHDAVAVRRYISVFDRCSEQFLGELSFSHEPPLTVLQAIFDAEDYLVEEYPITLDAAAQLRSYIEGDFDFEQHDYFLSCEATA